MTKRWLKQMLVCASMPLLAQVLSAQATPEALKQMLEGQPLYLRGLWMAGKLEFDGTGHLRGTSEQGPLTLSGIDVQSAFLQGKDLIIHAQRAALVVNREGRLERQSIYSTTHLEGSLRRRPNNTYIAYREVTLLVHPDAAGSFAAALKAVFANGLAELASSVPPYWFCYAQGYFVQTVSLVETRKTVAACVATHTLALADPEHGTADASYKPARIVSTAPAHVTMVAAELGVNGVSHVRFTVSPHVVPVGFQIMRAVGGGMDEEVLSTLARYHLQAAERHELAVPADLDVYTDFSAAP